MGGVWVEHNLPSLMLCSYLYFLVLEVLVKSLPRKALFQL